MGETAIRPSITFGAAIVSAFRQYAWFAGRAGLAEFWWFILFGGLVSTGLAALNELIPGVQLGASLASTWTLVALLPTLAVAVRRLRDGGNSWLQLFWLLVPIAGLIVIILRLCDPSKPEIEPAAEVGPDGVRAPRI